MKVLIIKNTSEIKMVVHDNWTNPILENEATLADLPEGLDEQYLKAIWKETEEEHWYKGDEKVFIEPMFPEYWAKEGETSVYEAPVDAVSWVYNPAIEDTSYTYAPYSFEHWAVFEDTTAKLVVQMDEEIASLKEIMIKDIYDQMELTFGTRNDISASATIQTYSRMIQAPAAYVTALAVGSEQEVIDYANGKLSEADAYAIFRLARLSSYEIDRQAIIANYGV